MKLLNLFILISITLIFSSCEEEADPFTFVPDENFQNAIEDQNPTTPDDGNGGDIVVDNNDIPRADNPIPIALIDDVTVFEAVGSSLAQTITENGPLLNMFFVNSNGDELLISLLNPSTRTYTIGSDVSFNATYKINDSGEEFTTNGELSATTNGSLDLVYFINSDNNAVASATFDFTISTDTTPIRSLKFSSTSEILINNLPVSISN